MENLNDLTLIMFHNKIRKDGLTNLCLAFKNKQKLKKIFLDFSNNYIPNISLFVFGQDLAKLPLTDLHIDLKENKKITDFGVGNLLQSLNQLKLRNFSFKVCILYIYIFFLKVGCQNQYKSQLIKEKKELYFRGS